MEEIMLPKQELARGADPCPHSTAERLLGSAGDFDRVSSELYP